MDPLIFLIALAAYLIGSIPTGAILAGYCGYDITKLGSGNIGATNVARVLGFRYFFIVFFIDAAKALYFLKLLTAFECSQMALWVGSICLLLGNGFSIFLNGKGGKGVATSIGILMAYNVLIIYCTGVIWLLALMITRTVGISSVIALFTLPFITYYLIPENWYIVCLVMFMGMWGIWRHADNIKRYFA